MKTLISKVFLFATLTGCASLGSDQKSGQLSFADVSAADLKPVAVTQDVGVAEYAFGGAPQKAEWIDCKVKTPALATILVFHKDRAGWEKERFCEGWIAQSFLSQGFDVVAVNRPGYGLSTGSPDFTGEQSLAAVDAALKDALAKGKNTTPVTGLWGYSTGATAAALYAKHAPGFKFIILGGGIYDFEETLKSTQDDYVRKDIEQMQKTGGTKALEDRSVGYDVAGLPKTVAIYHGKLDKSAPLAQAQAFADSLASNGAYSVTFQTLDGIGNDIPWAQHWKILEVLARTATGAGGK